MIPSPVIVLSSPHAEAARVAAMLGAHPRAMPLPELRLFHTDRVHDLMVMFERAGQRPGDGLLRAVAELCCDGQTDEGIIQARQYLERRAEWSTSELLMALLQKVSPKVAVLHDTAAPMRVSELDRWFEALPSAHYIHLRRHPVHFIDAAQREVGGRLNVPPDYKDHAGAYPRIEPQLLWYRVHHTLARELPTHGDAQLHELRLEDLCARPRPTLEALCDALGWSADEAAIEAMLHPERTRFARRGPITAPQGLEASFINEPCFHPSLAEMHRDGLVSASGLAQEVVALAARYGYS
jgi:hypothetical protein